MSMDGLRQGAQNIRTGGGKGPQRSAFYARWKPPQMTDVLKRFLAAPPNEESFVQVSEPIVLIKGQYSDPYQRDKDGNPIIPPPVIEAKRFRAHTFPVWIQPKTAGQQGFKTFREIVCSAGPEAHAPQPCVGCFQVDHGSKDSKPRDQWAFNIAHLAWYHTRPYVKDGQIQTKQNSNEPIMIKDECMSHKMENVLLGRAINARAQGVNKKYRQCEGCGQYAPQGMQPQQHPYIWGDHRTLQIGWGHLKRIFDLDDEIGKKCANCGTHIIRIAFDCGRCNNEMINVAQTGWTNEQLDQYSKTHQQCGQCGNVDLPVSVYECGYNEQYMKVGGGCPDNIDPRITSIFDVVLFVQREGEGTDSELVVKRWEPISQYKTPDGRPLSEHLKEIVKAPFNLDEMYAPDSLDDQAETIRVQNPYAQQQQQFQAYPGQPQPGGYGPPAAGGYGPAPGGPGFAPPPGVPYPNPYGQQPQQPQQGQQPVYPNQPMPGRPNFGK